MKEIYEIVRAAEKSACLKENKNADGTVNWDFVCADMFMDFMGRYSEDEIMYNFELAADDYDKRLKWAIENLNNSLFSEAAKKRYDMMMGL